MSNKGLIDYLVPIPFNALIMVIIWNQVVLEFTLGNKMTYTQGLILTASVSLIQWITGWFYKE